MRLRLGLAEGGMSEADWCTRLQLLRRTIFLVPQIRSESSYNTSLLYFVVFPPTVFVFGSLKLSQSFPLTNT
jgi:hypothetical protein